MYYCQSRYYDPAVGRFINADDVAFLGADGSVLSYNLFAYCNNNPAIKIDLSGKIGITAIGIIVSGAIGGIVSAAGTAVSGGSGWEIVTSFFVGAITAGATAGVAAVSTLSLTAATLCSVGIGFLGEVVSQGAEYAFHCNDSDYQFDYLSSGIKLLYSSGMGALGGYVSKGVNLIFVNAAKIGLFVSSIASTSLGSIDFGSRQIIAATTTPKSENNGYMPENKKPVRLIPRNYIALPV